MVFQTPEPWTIEDTLRQRWREEGLTEEEVEGKLAEWWRIEGVKDYWETHRPKDLTDEQFRKFVADKVYEFQKKLIRQRTWGR